VSDLLKQLVRKSYRKNLLKTLDFDISYKGTKLQGGDTRVITEAQDKNKPHDPPVRVDYIVKQTGTSFTAVDFVTEGSSLVKNYYTQFRTKMDDPNLGYPNIVAKLKEKIAKP
jgi:phospholipid transport system substrate-binding protein